MKIPNSMFGAITSLKAANGSTVVSRKILNNLFTIENLSKGFYYLNIMDEHQNVLTVQKIIVQ